MYNPNPQTHLHNIKLRQVRRGVVQQRETRDLVLRGDQGTLVLRLRQCLDYSGPLALRGMRCVCVCVCVCVYLCE